MTVPELRARFLEEQTHGADALIESFVGKRPSRAEELRIRVIASSLVAAVFVALEIWQREDGRPDLRGLLDRAIGALAEGMRELDGATST
jgi:hypothetical protein